MPPQIPLPRLAAAILLGALPPLVLYAVLAAALVGFHDGASALRQIGTFALFAYGGAIFIGVPIAGILLRAPEASALLWSASGAGTGLIAITLLEIWVAGPAFPMLFLSFAGPLLLVLNGISVLFGALTAVIARAILPNLCQP